MHVGLLRTHYKIETNEFGYDTRLLLQRFAGRCLHFQAKQTNTYTRLTDVPSPDQLCQLLSSYLVVHLSIHLIYLCSFA